MVPILVPSLNVFAILILFSVSICRAEVITGTNFDAKNWNLIMNFREGAGTFTTDSSSNVISSTLVAGPTWVSGKTGRGNAINFDGVNDTIRVSTSAMGLFSFTNRSTFTIVILFTNPSGGDNRIFASRMNWPQSGWMFRTGASGAKLGVYLRGTDTDYQYLEASGITNAMFINDNWHTAAFVYRGKLIGTQLKEFWFDGVSYPLTDSATAGGEASILPSATIIIGNDDPLTFTTMIDQIGCVMISRDGYAPDATGMMSLHRRLMGQVSQGSKWAD